MNQTELYIIEVLTNMHFLLKDIHHHIYSNTLEESRRECVDRLMQLNTEMLDELNKEIDK